jgi:hypothetical protein
VDLALSGQGGAAIRGRATRLGQLRLAARLGQAALAAPSVVVIHSSGSLSEDATAADGLVQVSLIDDPPAPKPRTSGWIERLRPVAMLAIWVLSLIGLATVLNWLVT